MKEIIINNQQISVKEYNGQRVTTFRDIDRIHERPEGTAKRNFQQNIKYFVEGTDYYKVSASQKDEFRTFEIPNRGIILLTESGYLMLVKSMNDPVAWKIQRMLVDNYFHAGREQAPDPFTKTWRGVPVITIAEASDLTGRAVSKDMIRYYLGKIPGIRPGEDFFSLGKQELWEFKAENADYFSAINHVTLLTRDGFEKLMKPMGALRQKKTGEKPEKRPALPAPSAAEPGKDKLQSAIADVRRKVCALDTMLEFIQETHGIPHTGQNEAERLRTVSDFGMMLSAELVILKRYGKEEK